MGISSSPSLLKERRKKKKKGELFLFFSIAQSLLYKLIFGRRPSLRKFHVKR